MGVAACVQPGMKRITQSIFSTAPVVAPDADGSPWRSPAELGDSDTCRT